MSSPHFVNRRTAIPGGTLFQAAVKGAELGPALSHLCLGLVDHLACLTLDLLDLPLRLLFLTTRDPAHRVAGLALRCGRLVAYAHLIPPALRLEAFSIRQPTPCTCGRESLYSCEILATPRDSQRRRTDGLASREATRTNGSAWFPVQALSDIPAS